MRAVFTSLRLAVRPAVLAAGALLALSTSPAQALTAVEGRHLLSRTGFDADPATIEALAPLSHEAAVAALLANARTVAATPPPDWVRAWQPPDKRPRDMGEADRKALRRRNRTHALGPKAWWYREMIATQTPITEVMTLFWHNHFTSSLPKVKAPALLYRQNVLLRRHALGNFAELLHAVARDPAMLLYLDGARSRKGAPNENFARELLELFTLGEGHYGEADVKAAARAFTGWSLDRKTGSFRFRKAWHDGSSKRFLGRQGRFDGDDIIQILLAEPRTAELIVEKLWRAFVSPEPDRAEVTRLAALFRRADYEIKPLLSALLTSDAFRAPETRGTLIKSPVDLIVGTVRTFDLKIDRPNDLALIGRRLGQDLFAPPNVKGWPGGNAWITSDSLLMRDAVLRRVTGLSDAPLGPGQKGTRPRYPAPLRAAVFDRWAADLEAPWAGARDVAALLLPIAPVDVEVLDRQASGALVRQLLTDPAYQLK